MLVEHWTSLWTKSGHQRVTLERIGPNSGRSVRTSKWSGPIRLITLGFHKVFEIVRTNSDDLSLTREWGLSTHTRRDRVYATPHVTRTRLFIQQSNNMGNEAHNADQAARKAEMMQRAQMAIDGRQGAVGCGHTEEVAKPATEAVSAQKSGRVAGADTALYYAEFLGAGSRTRKVLIQVRARRHCGRDWLDVTHAEKVCGVEQMREWVNTYGDKRNHYRVIDRVETTLLAPAEMMRRHKKTPSSTH